MVNRILKLAGFLSVFAALLLFSKIAPASASIGDNIRGIAYTGSGGYIVFNCLDDNFGGRFPFTFPFLFRQPPCTYPYGVNLDANNNFSGNAWNEAKGFVTFNAPSTPSDDFRALCDNGNTCTNANSCTACYNETDEKVYGYMRVVGGEWIRLDNTVINPTTQITNFEAASQPGVFSGYATSTTFGAISFNCSNDNSCLTNDYKVKIGPLEIRQQLGPNWSGVEACVQGADKAVLSWNLRSGVQSNYQVIVNTVDSMSNPFFDSGKVAGDAKQLLISNLDYSTQYYWFLKLWDDTGTSTAWRQFNINNPGRIKDKITNSFASTANPKTFLTYKHRFPRPYFTWSPTDIVIATSTNSFVSTSSYYNSADILQPCNGSTCALTWSTSDTRANILSPNSASTSIMFTRATSTVVTLTAQDNDLYACSIPAVMNVNYALPVWKEIKP